MKGKLRAGPQKSSSSLIFPRRSSIPGLLPTVDAGLDAGNAIEGGPNVEAEDWAAIGERRGGVVVDDVSDIFSRIWAVDNPIVSIEWWLGAVWGGFKNQEMLGSWGR